MQNRAQKFKNPPKIHPKSSQNPPKTLPKRSPNPPKATMEYPMRSKNVFFSIFSIFCHFLEGSRPPKIDPKLLKSAKKRIKIDVRKKYVFQHRFFSIFRCFDLQKRTQNCAKWAQHDPKWTKMSPT